MYPSLSSQVCGVSLALHCQDHSPGALSGGGAGGGGRGSSSSVLSILHNGLKFENVAALPPSCLLQDPPSRLSLRPFQTRQLGFTSSNC